MLGRTLKITAFATLLALLAAAQTIPAGTHITVRTSQELSSGSAKVGSKYQGQRGPTPSRYWKNFAQ